MSSFARYLLAVLAILGLGTSQVFGVGGGFVCQCSGEPVMAEGSNCDTGGCHDDADLNNTAQPENQNDRAPGEPHEHQKLTKVFLGPTFAPLAVALPLVAVCQALPGVNCAFISVSENTVPERTASAPSGCGPPLLSPGVLVARTVVMLV